MTPPAQPFDLSEGFSVRLTSVLSERIKEFLRQKAEADAGIGLIVESAIGMHGLDARALVQGSIRLSDDVMAILIDAQPTAKTE